MKSPFELDCLRRAGQHAEAGLRAAREHARPGVTERRARGGGRVRAAPLGLGLPVDPDRADVGPAHRVRPRDAGRPRRSSRATSSTSRSAASRRATTRSGSRRSASATRRRPAPASTRSRSRASAPAWPRWSPGSRPARSRPRRSPCSARPGWATGSRCASATASASAIPPTWLDPLEITRHVDQQLPSRARPSCSTPASWTRRPRSASSSAARTAVGEDGLEQLAGAGGGRADGRAGLARALVAGEASDLEGDPRQLHDRHERRDEVRAGRGPQRLPGEARYVDLRRGGIQRKAATGMAPRLVEGEPRIVAVTRPRPVSPPANAVSRRRRSLPRRPAKRSRAAQATSKPTESAKHRAERARPVERYASQRLTPFPR